MIGTSTGEVYEDSVDHLLDTSNKRVSDSFSDLKPENPIIETPTKPKEAGMGAEMAGSKAASWTAWLASLPTSYAGAATRVTGAMSGVEAALTMYKMKTEIVDDVRKQVKSGTPIDKIKFEDGSAADGYGLFSSLQNHFKKPISEINSPQHATDDDAQRDSYNFFKALNDATNPEAFKSAMSRWPLSTNIEDRRGEAPIASRTREDWGKGGLLPAMDSDRLKMGKPLMEIPSGAGGSYPRITSPDINRTPSNTNLDLAEARKSLIRERMQWGTDSSEFKTLSKQIDTLTSKLPTDVTKYEQEAFKQRLDEFRNRLITSGREIPKDIVQASKKLDHLGNDKAGQAVSQIREFYDKGGIESVKKGLDIQPKDELYLQKIINWIKVNPLK